jgi:hypothetical protein
METHVQVILVIMDRSGIKEKKACDAWQLIRCGDWGRE